MRQSKTLDRGMVVLVYGFLEYRSDEWYSVTVSDEYRAECQLASPSLTIYPTISPLCSATTRPWVSLDGMYRVHNPDQPECSDWAKSRDLSCMGS